MEGKLRPDDIDRLISDLAERQHGVTALRQLVEIGVTRKAVEFRLRCARLHRVHRGVYAVGHRLLSADGWRMAAVLAAGPRAVVSHVDAAAIHGLLQSSRAITEVTLPYRRKPSRGIRAHYARLPPDEITTVRGIPVTTVPRTILDLAAVRRREDVERALHESEVQRLTDPLSLHDLLARYPRRHGSRAVRAILTERRTVPKSVLERAFTAFVRRYRLPRPEVNVWLTIDRHTYEIDCLWRGPRVIVELDGRAAHDTAKAFESDREKDRRLTVARWQPLRVTWKQLHGAPAQLAADLRTLLVPA
jgi:very-short-patch-repair endonuclease/predicted transcriptional regulator of viral defense system